MKQVNRSLILIGFMGTGKSTLGNVLAEKLNRQQVDLDDVIVKEQNMAISDIFAKYGEAKFRELEHDVLCRYAAKPGLIISPGGGAALRAETIDARQADYSRCAIAIGSEGRGLSAQMLDICDRTVLIPMQAHCESLNAAIAATVLLWEAARND
jgi:hypothetical protein